MPLREIVVGRDEEDRKKYGKKGTIYFGKHLVGEGAEANLTNPVHLDVARPHVSLICGKRGQGKCVVGNTKILKADGSQEEIAEVFQEVKGRGKWIVNDGGEELMTVPSSFDILSWNPTKKKIEPREVSHVYRKRVDEELLKITTSSEREITVTKEHPLLLKSGWREAAQLKKGVEIGIFDQKAQFEQIKSIKKVEHSGWVYDLTVPGTHNFLAGENGGLICHNSYTGAVIAEEFFRLPDEIRNNLCMLMIDTMGIWWSLKNPNEKQMELLKKWGLKPRSFGAEVYVPEGFKEDYKESDIPFDSSFSIKASELTTQDWALAFKISLVDPLGILLERVMRGLEDEGNYGIDDIIKAINNDKRASDKEKQALENRFLTAREWGIFSKEGLSIGEILSPGKVSVLDVSYFGHLSSGWSVRGLLVGLLSRRIYRERVKARRKEEVSTIRGAKELKIPLTWIVMDEAHQFLPEEGKTPASDPLITLVKQGRQPGISTIFITQRPNKIHPDAISQADVVVSHRLTARPDLEALRNIMQTYMTFDIQEYINDLPRKKGAAIILDDNSERLYSMRVRPRMSWHAGGTPIAFEKEEEEF